MTDKQKRFYRAAKPKEHTKFKSIYICDTGKKYNGFLGENGFNSMIIIGESVEGTLELISDWSDIFSCICDRQFQIDIDNNDGMIRIQFNRPIWIDEALSTCIGCGLPPGQ